MVVSEYEREGSTKHMHAHMANSQRSYESRRQAEDDHFSLLSDNDHLQNKPNKLEYCPTELMLADFYKASLQGNMFKKFRCVVMGWDPILVLQKEYHEEYSD